MTNLQKLDQLLSCLDKRDVLAVMAKHYHLSQLFELWPDENEKLMGYVAAFSHLDCIDQGEAMASLMFFRDDAEFGVLSGMHAAGPEFIPFMREALAKWEQGVVVSGTAPASEVLTPAIHFDHDDPNAYDRAHKAIRDMCR